MATETRPTFTMFAVLMGRLVMIATGLGTAYVGYSLLTRPLAIPFTVLLWLVAAAVIALGARGKIEKGWGGFDAGGHEA